MADVTVRTRYEADISGYKSAMSQAAGATDKLAASADKAGASSSKMAAAAERASAKVASTAEKAAQAQKRAENAAGRLREANARLDAARSSGKTERVVAAEERVARAQREVEATSRQAATAHNQYERAVSEAATAQEQYEQATKEAARASADLAAETDQVGGRFSQMSDAISASASNMQQVGQSLATVGAGMTAVAGTSVKAAMDWESAWAGVAKTNDGNTQQMQALEQGLRDMTSVLPASHQEIAAVAEAAGQLGVGIDDVEGFTKTMIDLGESTNLTAEEAASSLAKFSNIMGTSLTDVDRLGSVVVGLGNNFATTESDIVAMSTRLAGVGQQMGMTEGDVMALGAAMSSVGIEAEAGGTAMSTTMKKIDAAVRGGGDSLAKWADVAGMSAEQFASAWESDPARALDTLVTGLGEAGASGQDMNQILSDLGITGIREADTMIRLAGASGVLGDALTEGNTAWEQNTALVAEAEKRYETAESRIRIAWNQIKDAAITAGGALLPVVADIATKVGDLASAFGDLPAPVQGGIGAMTGVAGAAALAGGGLLMLLPRLVETQRAAKALATDFPRATSAMGKLGKAAGVAAAAFVGFEVAKGLVNSMADFTVTVEDAANALLRFGETKDMAAIDEMFDIKTMDGTSQAISGFAEALDAINPTDAASHVASFGDDVLGLENPTHQARQSVEKLDQALATMDASAAAEQVNRLRKETEATDGPNSRALSSWSELKKVFPEYAAAVQAAANETGQATTGAELFQAAMGNLPPHMRDAAGAAGEMGAAMGEAGAKASETSSVMDKLGNVNPSGMKGISDAMGILADESTEAADKLGDVMDALFKMGIIQQSAHEATAAYAASLDAVTASIAENGATMDITTEAGRANQEALFGIADAGRALAQANAEAGASQGTLSQNLQDTYNDLVASGQQMGLTAAEADHLARQVMGIDPNVDIQTAMDDAALVMASATGQAVEAIPGHRAVTIAVSENGDAGSIQEKINAITGKTEHVFVTEDGTTTKVQQQIQNINGVERKVWVDDQGTVYGVQEDINALQGKDVTVGANANVGGAETILNNLARPRTQDTTAQANTSGAEASFGVLARDRQTNILGVSFMHKAEADANHTARDRTSNISGNPLMSAAESSANHTARDRTSNITANPITAAAETALNSTARDRIARVQMVVTETKNRMRNLFGNASGGRVQAPSLPSFATGGRLPATGLGTDKILGVSSKGTPTAWVDDKEWVINRRSSDKYNRLLGLINQDHPSIRRLSGLASGGRPGAREFSATVPAPVVHVAGPSGQQIDPAAIYQAVHAGAASVTPVFKMGNRDLLGAMQAANNLAKGR